MRRVGIYSGRVYSDSYDISQIKECALVVGDNMTDEAIKKEWDARKWRCIGCFACEMASSATSLTNRSTN